MSIIRLIVACVVCGGLAFYLGHVIIYGLKTGQVRHTDSSGACRKSHNPVGYWLLILLFSLIAIGSVAMVGKVVYEAISL
jgi:hypothetical protein